MEPAQFRKVLAENMRRVAKRRQVSLNKVADLAGMSRRAFYRILACQAAATADTICLVAQALGVQPRELTDERTVDHAILRAVEGVVRYRTRRRRRDRGS